MIIALLALARIVAEAGAPAMPVADDGGVLLMKRHDPEIGCTPGDAGPDDAGPGDAGPDDAGPGDAGPGDAGACTTIDGDAITLVVQPRFSQLTSGARFAILMVTPAPPSVDVVPAGVFADLAATTAPLEIVHEREIEDPAYGQTCDSSGCGGGGNEGGGCDAPATDEPWTPPALHDAAAPDLDGGYAVDALGPYEVLRAQPADADELRAWLTGLGYLALPADVDAVAPYITAGYTVVALRVRVDATPEAALAPIALTWPGSELRLPVALGEPAGGAAHTTTVYISADAPYQLPGADIEYAAPATDGYLTKNVAVLESASPDEDPAGVLTNGLYVKPTVDVYHDVHVPVRVACRDDDDDDDHAVGCCRQCNARRAPRFDLLAVIGVVLFVCRRRRR